MSAGVKRQCNPKLKKGVRVKIQYCIFTLTPFLREVFPDLVQLEDYSVFHLALHVFMVSGN